MEVQGPPRVTALIVSRNDENLLRRCLEGLERSSGRESLEILVVDDGSQDGTERVPDDFPAVISLKLPKRLGWTRAVNIGLRTAKGDLVCLIHPRFQVHPDTISLLADGLESSSEIGAVCPRISQTWPFPSPGDLLQDWKTGELPGALHITGEEAFVDYPRGSLIMTRRALLRAMNFLDARFGERWSDLEMCSRIRNGGKKIAVLTSVVVEEIEVPPDDLTMLEWTDSATGIAAWTGLHYGFAAGLKARLGMALYALLRGKTSVFTGILTAAKIDGNH